MYAPSSLLLCVGRVCKGNTSPQACTMVISDDALYSHQSDFQDAATTRRLTLVTNKPGLHLAPRILLYVHSQSTVDTVRSRYFVHDLFMPGVKIRQNVRPSCADAFIDSPTMTMRWAMAHRLEARWFVYSIA